MLGAVAARLDLLERDFDISNHAGAILVGHRISREPFVTTL